MHSPGRGTAVAPQRQRQIEELCRAARDRKGGERAAFLDAACGGDSELRREVESRLSQVPEMPASIGHYRILGKLGEGGMGVVYRAVDTRLQREVAIKVLPQAWAGDPARMARFRREAHLLASLN